ncbi:MAG: DNA methyltransferase [Polyangiaceae bacterium]
MAMFPPTIPHTFIRWLTKPGDVVYDPFCGRGTTPLEACLLKRRWFGSDANPLALLLSAAKVDPPSQRQLQERLRVLRRTVRRRHIDKVPEHIQMLFTERTLGELLSFKAQVDLTRPTDRFLMATLLGILHANADKNGIARGLTVAMPNTFSMAPGYVDSYIRAHGLIAPDVGVLDALERRIDGFCDISRPEIRGRIWRRDASSSLSGAVACEPAKLVFTSPPYLQAILYGKFNWIRLWMLDRTPKEVDNKLFTSRSLSKYVDFMKKVLRGARESMRDDGYACFVIGDVWQDGNELNLAQAVADGCVEQAGLRTLGIISDRLPVEHKVSRIWKENRGRATRTDRLLLLAAPRAPRLQQHPRIDWTASY